MKPILFTILLLFTVPTSAEVNFDALFNPRTSKDYIDNVSYGFALGALVTDWATTRHNIAHGARETGWLANWTGTDTPSPGQINTYFIGHAAILTLANTWQPVRRYRFMTNLSYFAVHIRATSVNISVGGKF
jgi:hypothetical protein